MEIKNKQKLNTDTHIYINLEMKRGGRPHSIIMICQPVTTQLHSLNERAKQRKICSLFINYRSDESDKSHFISSLGFACRYCCRPIHETPEKKKHQMHNLNWIRWHLRFSVEVYDTLSVSSLLLNESLYCILCLFLRWWQFRFRFSSY